MFTPKVSVYILSNGSVPEALTSSQPLSNNSLQPSRLSIPITFKPATSFNFEASSISSDFQLIARQMLIDPFIIKFTVFILYLTNRVLIFFFFTASISANIIPLKMPSLQAGDVSSPIPPLSSAPIRISSLIISSEMYLKPIGTVYNLIP